MPPHSRSTSVSWSETLTSPSGLKQHFIALVFLSALLAVVRSYLVSRQRRRTIAAMSCSSSPSPSPPKNPLPTPPTPEKSANAYLDSIKKETSQPDSGPVFPWVSPPQLLPGPYDSPYYPLPIPTIRRHSHDPQSGKTGEAEEQITMTTYNRRISTNSIPDHETILEGSVTTSTQGWRRNYWTVTTG